MLCLMINCILRYHYLVIGPERIAGIGIGLKARSIAAGNGHTDPVALIEDNTGRPQINFEAVNLTRLHQVLIFERFPVAGPDNTILQQNRSSVGVYVGQFHGEVGIST